jgi:hypothetical protein
MATCIFILLRPPPGIFAPFPPPDPANPQDFRLKSDDGKYKVVVEFLSNDYLKLKVGREMAFIDGDPPSDAPEVFEFVGISRDYEKDLKKKDKEKKKKQRKTREARSQVDKQE